ncbi:MAG: cytochrome c biogenesis protein CcsA, partial [Anaerolineae bacterium]
MLAEIGSILSGLALAAALYAVSATFWSIRRGDSRWAESGRNSVYAAAGFLGLALLALLAAFLGDQFQIEYVFQHSSRDLPVYLKASAVWAGQDGSLLLWAFLQALFAALVVGRPSKRSRPLVPWAAIFLNLITVFFVAVTLFASNPFARLATIPADGRGLNPLLRHPGMIFHPPALYLGYVGLAVPFAFGLAALVTRHMEDWPAAAHRWTLVSWLFLGLGLLLGMRWAYDVLGWGGYWGWDPVENAGLMPWLTTTALLHGMVMQEQGRGFRLWNSLLVIGSFILVLFGTFTTRSGLIQSVHAFGRSNLGLYFLGAIVLTLAGSLALLLKRRSLLTRGNSSDGLLSRQGMFLFTLVLFLTITGSVLVGSILPTLTEALTDQRFEAGPSWFDRVTGPQFGALVLVMGLCPLLGRAAGAL